MNARNNKRIDRVCQQGASEIIPDAPLMLENVRHSLWMKVRMYTDKQLEIVEWIRNLTARSYRGWRAFYHTTEWKRKRKDILKRDHNECTRCRQFGEYTKAITVHHIKHLKDVPELALTDENLTSLCKDCHDAMHPKKNKMKTGYQNEERW